MWSPRNQNIEAVCRHATDITVEAQRDFLPVQSLGSVIRAELACLPAGFYEATNEYNPEGCTVMTCTFKKSEPALRELQLYMQH